MRPRSNELVFSDSSINVPFVSIERRCWVRLVKTSDIKAGRIPVPYDRGGTGDLFIIADGNDNAPTPLFKQGPIPGATPTLDCLSLFCGGGSFDRGLEEGGAVKTRYAVDYDKLALHTYHANLKFENETQLFLGSVDTYLSMALRGYPEKVVAEINGIDFMSAGSPCTGFSTAQPNRLSDGSKKNASLVASVLAYIDLYRPG